MLVPQRKKQTSKFKSVEHVAVPGRKVKCDIDDKNVVLDVQKIFMMIFNTL